MKNILSLIIPFVIITVLLVNCRRESDVVTAGALESGFIVPPDSVQTSVYWYWISDNI
ncbi:MAG: hypothetical protein ACP5D9_19550 [Mariniphaga sp.]